MNRFNTTFSLLIILFIFALFSISINTVTVHAQKTSSDDANQSSADNGQNADTQNQQPRNHPPKADAGNDKIVKESESVLLDGSNSVDPDGDKLSFSWQLISPKNVKIKLNNEDSTKPDFVAPSLDGTSNKLTLVFKLTVRDDDSKSSDTMKILVTAKNIDNRDNYKINTLTVIDTGTPPSKNQFFAADVCGAGTSAYSYLAPGVKWKTFPVTFGFDLSTSTPTLRNAVRNAFATYDSLEQPAGAFFKEWGDLAAAKIKITWKYIDGPYNQLAKTSISYRTDTHALTSASITFDSGDKFFVSSTERCGVFGNQFDVQNIATHEIGHAINLGHVSDRLQSMYSTSYAGETLKRTLGNGDKVGVNNLY